MQTLFSYFSKSTSQFGSIPARSGRELPTLGGKEELDSSDDDSAVQVQTSVHQLYSASNMDVDTKVQVVMFAEQNSVHAALRRFPGLAASTVRRWVDMVRKARQDALRRAPAGAQAITVSYADALSDARVNNGRVLPEGALTAAFDRFMDAREAGMLVSTELLRQIVLSEVTKVDATIVHSASNPGGWFKCTDMWLRRWKTDNFISRRAVTTARRADVDKEATRTRFLHRVAFVVHKYGIPMELAYHADETGPYSTWPWQIASLADSFLSLGSAELAVASRGWFGV